MVAASTGAMVSAAFSKMVVRRSTTIVPRDSSEPRHGAWQLAVLSQPHRPRLVHHLPLLIASCHLRGINPQLYIEEEVLRLASHRSATQMLRLTPNYWQQTRAAVSPRSDRDHSIALRQLCCLSAPLRRRARRPRGLAAESGVASPSGRGRAARAAPHRSPIGLIPPAPAAFNHARQSGNRQWDAPRRTGTHLAPHGATPRRRSHPQGPRRTSNLHENSLVDMAECPPIDVHLNYPAETRIHEASAKSRRHSACPPCSTLSARRRASASAESL